MKKLFAIMLAAVLVMAMFAGCSGKRSASENKIPTEIADAATVLDAFARLIETASLDDFKACFSEECYDYQVNYDGDADIRRYISSLEALTDGCGDNVRVTYNIISYERCSSETIDNICWDNPHFDDGFISDAYRFNVEFHVKGSSSSRTQTVSDLFACCYEGHWYCASH